MHPFVEDRGSREFLLLLTRRRRTDFAHNRGMIRWIALAKGAGLVFCALALAGCPSNTYVSPTEKYTFRAREPVDNDVEIFRRNYLAFAEKTADSLPKIAREKPVAISLVGIYQLGLALLSGSESQSFAAVTSLLASDQADEFSLNQGFSDWLGRLRKSESIRVRSSMWMIWPMKLEEPFVKDMAEHNDVDIIRLGSVGLTAERALDAWMKRATSDPEAVHPKPFSKRVMTLGVAVTALELEPNPDQALFFQVGETPMAEIPTGADGLRLFALKSREMLPALLRQLPSTDQAGEKFTIPSLNLPPKTQLDSLIEQQGASSLFEGQNDFRNMSVEIAGDYKLGPIWQHMNLSIPGEKSTTGPTWFVLWDANEKLPLALAYVP